MKEIQILKEAKKKVANVTVGTFLELLSHKIVRYDRLNKGKKYYNPHAMGQMLDVKSEIAKKVAGIKDSQKARDIMKLQALISSSYNAVGSVNAVIRSIDKYLQQGTIPKI